MSGPDGVSSRSPVNAGRFATTAADRVRVLSLGKTVAIVGLSGNPFRPSHFVAIYLRSRGYEVIPVNPREKEILGVKSYGSLREIPKPVDIVDIFRDAAAVPAIVEEAISIGAKAIWMQLGVVSEEGADAGRRAGLEVVMDRCMKIEHARYFGGLHTLGLNTGVISPRRQSGRE
ncbi:MAG: CoA-binding protein [Acidobacteriota bacterium]|nr:CoA-binding protein [Acidobacteriota bacterium]